MIWHHCQEQMVDSHATGQGRNNSDRKNKGERLGLRDRNKGRRHTQGQTRALGGGVRSALFEIFNFKNDFTTFTYLMYQCLLCASVCMHVGMLLQHRCSGQMTTWGDASSFCHVGAGDQTQIIQLGNPPPAGSSHWPLFCFWMHWFSKAKPRNVCTSLASLTYDSLQIYHPWWKVLNMRDN